MIYIKKKPKWIPLGLAKKINPVCKIAAYDQDGGISQSLSYTRGWTERFKRKHNIYKGKIHCEAGAASPEITKKWFTTVSIGL